MRDNQDVNAPWAFPNYEMMEDLYDSIMSELVIDEPNVFDVAITYGVDKSSGMASITLYTLNMPVFNLVRQAIRSYTGKEGYTFESYSKIAFMKQNALTIYVPRKYKWAVYIPLMRKLFDNYHSLISDYQHLYTMTFTADRDDRQPGQRSRIGDKIIVLGGNDLMTKIQAFPENFVFHIMERWKITIRGGQRVGDQLTPEELELVRASASFSKDFSEQLISGMAKEAAEDVAAGQPHASL